MHQNNSPSLIPANFILPEEDANFYERNGYILVKALLSKDKVDLYNQRFADIANGVVPKKPFMILMKDITIAKKGLNGAEHITKLQEFQDDEVMFGYSKEPRILDYVKAIIGNKILAIHTMYINKPPDTGMGTSVHPAHQDLFYFPFRPHQHIVGIWTAMQEVNRQNGCLYLLPGSHTSGVLLEHTYPEGEIVNRGYLGIHNLTEAEKSAFIYLDMQAGDTLFFNPLLIHGSGPNLSAATRKACSTHYAALDCEIIDVKGTVQEGFAHEMENWAVQKGMPEGITFRDIWRGKSRRV